MIRCYDFPWNLNFPDFFCISWPVFLPYISFAIHDLDFSMLVIMCIYIYISIYLFIYLKYDFYIDDFFFRMSSLVSELCIRSNLRWYLDIGWVDLYVENGSIWKVRILLGDIAIFDWTMIMEGRVPGTTFFFVWLPKSFDSSSFLRYLTSPSPFVARLSAP